MKPYKVSYYAHHFGSGHLRHAQKVASSELFDLQVTSTGPQSTSLLNGRLDYVPLSPDVGSADQKMAATASSYLHYAPTDALIQQRFAELNQAWHKFKPDVVMVDVSVEVALFARLSGYRVAFRRMPGDRNDNAHQLAYELADTIFAYFPAAFEEPEHLAKFGHKSHYLSVAEPLENVSALDGHFGLSERSRVVVQTSLASSISLDQVIRAATDSPEWDWEVVGSVESGRAALPANLVLHGILADPLPVLRSADVIVSSAGHNAVVAAASCRRPVLLVPEDRPYSEQAAFARTLHNVAGIHMLESWQASVHWPEVLGRTAQGDPEALARALFVRRAEFEQRLFDLVQICAAGMAEAAKV